MAEAQEEFDWEAVDDEVDSSVFVDAVQEDSQCSVYHWLEQGADSDSSLAEAPLEDIEREHGADCHSLMGSGRLVRRDKHGFLLDSDDEEEQIRRASRGSTGILAAQEAWKETLAIIEEMGTETEAKVRSGARERLRKRLLELAKEFGIPREHRSAVWVWCMRHAYGYASRNDSETARGPGSPARGGLAWSGKGSPGESRDTEDSGPPSPRVGKGRLWSDESCDSASSDGGLGEAREGLYEQLLRSNAGQDSQFAEQISKDIGRTFPEHALFDTQAGTERLKRVLNAFAVASSIGYCQSMNFMGGFALLVLDEEDSFKLLLHIIEDLLPAQYYTNHMRDSQVDQAVLGALIKEKMPSLSRHARKHEINLTLATAQWFLCLFVGFLPSEVCFRVWDILLIDGVRIMFMVALALLKMNEKELLQCEDGAQGFMVVRDAPKRAHDSRLLFRLAYKKFGGVSMKKIATLRKAHKAQVDATIAEQVEKREAAVKNRERLAAARAVLEKARADTVGEEEQCGSPALPRPSSSALAIPCADSDSADHCRACSAANGKWTPPQTNPREQRRHNCRIGDRIDRLSGTPPSS